MQELLRRLGVFMAPGILGVPACRDICAQMLAADGEPGMVYNGVVDLVDPHQKRLHRTELPDGPGALVNAQLASLLPAFNRHFSLTLADHEGAMFYRYREGDFFATHRDMNPRPGAYSERRVSIVLFLNDPAGTAGPSYEGGDLVLYDLMDGAAADRGIAVPPQAGLLVAFRSDRRHEVTPVTSGVRCVAVDRFS